MHWFAQEEVIFGSQETDTAVCPREILARIALWTCSELMMYYSMAPRQCGSDGT